MKATEINVRKFFEQANTRFVIPVYQRNYDWTKVQCKQLLDDIIAVGRNETEPSHFIGSIVYVMEDLYTASDSDINELMIIDGQQRLTTLTLMYLVLYNFAGEAGDKSRQMQISENYLINKFAKAGEQLKLVLTTKNNETMQSLLNNSVNLDASEYSRIISNYQYLEQQISQHDLGVFSKGLFKLMFVEISLDRTKDNPQRIFESLNSTGLELSQGDLIRNYILMGLERQEQYDIYDNYWRAIEQYATDEDSNKSLVSDFIRDYLTSVSRKIPNKNKVYDAFKIEFPNKSADQIKGILQRIKIFSQHFNKLINPHKEKDRDIQLHLQYIKRMEINVSYPFLMQVYDDYIKEQIDKSIFISVLELVQSFTFRRQMIELPTNALNKVFMSLYKEEVPTSKYVQLFEQLLSQKKGSQRFPTDQEVLSKLKTKDIYNIKYKNKKYLFDRLENHLNKETVEINGNPDITIEHIFPQTPHDDWVDELGEEQVARIKEHYLHTIGNLTFIGYNSKLGNKLFSEKRDLPGVGYKASRLWLNKSLAETSTWGEEAITNRTSELSKRFLAVWKYPAIGLRIESEEEAVNIFDAEDPTHRKLEYAIFFDDRIEVKNVSELYIEVMKILFEAHPESFLDTKLGNKFTIVPNIDANRLMRNSALNAAYSIESNLSSAAKFSLIKEALSTLNLDEDLLIKYQPEANMMNDSSENSNKLDQETSSFGGSSNTTTFTLESKISFTHTKIQSYIFKGQQIEVRNWVDFYHKVHGRLFRLYPEKYSEFANDLEHQTVMATDKSMHKPIPLSEGIYIEGNRSVNDLLTHLRSLVNKLGIDLSEISVVIND